MNDLIALEWTNELEYYLKEIGEKCYAYQVIHKKSQIKYDYQANFLNIPSIILSTICGSLSIGSDKLFKEDEYASVYIGVGSIFVGVLQTLSSYFIWNKRAEQHNQTSLNYGKLYRFIQLQLTLPREQRIDLKNLLKMIREDYEKLQTESPLIPNSIIEEFKKKYKNYKVAKPAEANGLERINIFSQHTNIRSEMNDEKIQIEKELSNININQIIQENSNKVITPTNNVENV